MSLTLDGTTGVTTTGNVTAAYLFGNASQLTGISSSKIYNGTSEANIGTSGGNANISIGGVSNVVVVTTTGANIAGTLNATGNANVGNLGTSGNITAGYLFGNGSQLTGIDSTAINNGTSNVRVNSSGGNATISVGGTPNVAVFTTTGANVAGTLNATGNANVGNLGATNVVATNLTGTLTTATQTNITQVGTLTSLAVAGNISPGGISMTTGNASIGNLYVSGTTTIAGNITQISGNSGQFFGNATTGFNALYAGLPAGYSLVPQSIVNFISSFNGYSQLNLQNTSAGNLSTSDYVLTSDEGDDTSHYVDLGIAGSTYDGNTAALNNSLGNIVKPGDGYLYVTGDVGNARIGNLTIGTPDTNSMTTIINGGSSTGNVSAQFFVPNVAATSATTGTFRVNGGIATTSTVWATGNVTGAYFVGNGSQLTGIDATAIQNGSANARAFLNGNVTISAAGTANVVVVTSTGANIAGTLNTGTGNISGGNLTVGTGTITGGNIVNSNANGTGNIGSSTVYFNTVFAKATSAQYADLAEKYVADKQYEIGTVLRFGGINEVTESDSYHDTRIAGTVSENPAYLMNSGLDSANTVAVALLGRVPCRVVGTIVKGDRLVSSEIRGVATVLDSESYQPGCIIGKALEAYNSDEPGVIEIVVGRL